MENKYSTQEVTDKKQWDAFVERSPQGTLFSHVDYLDAALSQYELLWVMKGNEIKAGIALPLSADKKTVFAHDHLIHGGILFEPPTPDQKGVKYRSDQFSITEFLIQYLSQRFDHVQLVFSPQFSDIRPFLWHNYHDANPLNKYKVETRYTSYLNVSELREHKEEESYELFKGLETLRQRNIREARSQNAVVENKIDLDNLLKFYVDLMEKQGQEVVDTTLESMRKICTILVEKNKAEFFCLKGSAGVPSYITCFGYDSKRAYYLFGAGDPNASERYRGTITFWDAFKTLAKRGIDTIDFEGVNSPKRGAFKLSFGGSLVPYYQVSI